MNSLTDSQRADETTALPAKLDSMLEQLEIFRDCFVREETHRTALIDALKQTLKATREELKASQNAAKHWKQECTKAEKRAVEAEARAAEAEARAKKAEKRAEDAVTRALLASKAERRVEELNAQVRVLDMQRRFTQMQGNFNDSVVGGQAFPRAVSATNASLPSKVTTSAPTIINNYVNGSGCQVFNDNAQVAFHHNKG